MRHRLRALVRERAALTMTIGASRPTDGQGSAPTRAAARATPRIDEEETRMHRATTTAGRIEAVEAVRGTRCGPRGRGGRDANAAQPVGAGRFRRRPRPARRDVDQAAPQLITRRGTEILGTARHYAATPDDAEDAYQRGLEILLRKAPTTSEEELVPWLKTVVKHEAFALRRQRERHSPVTDDGQLGERSTAAEITHDQAALYERLRQGAEALGQLNPQEIRALQLKAEGYSYREICQITSWTYTNVYLACAEVGRGWHTAARAVPQLGDPAWVR
jgi:RNA polymerase sigma factor (sigma-70 family)